MNDFIKNHLESVHSKGLMDFREKEAFTLYATCRDIKLGVDGMGNYVVIDAAGKKHRSVFAEKAIEIYSELLSKEIGLTQK